jgi:hypothetical protein
MKRTVLTTYGLLLALTALPAFAWHGAPESKDRDPWIDRTMGLLVDARIVGRPSQALSDLTNREMAKLTSEAAHLVLAQADLPEPMGEPGLPPSNAPSFSPQAGQGVASLAEEFRSELSTMASGLRPLEEKSFDRERMNEALDLLQERYLRRTGTQASGSSRGWFHTTDIPGSQPLFTDVIFMEMHFKSVPVPQNLFDLKLRIWRTIGLYYADPISTRFEMRWISLNNVNEICRLTAGDFYDRYSPLTLWNPEVPVYTLLEPTSYERRRKEAEEILFLDHGNDWRLRGFRAAASWPGEDPKSFTRLEGQVMTGSLKSPTDLRFGDYFAGTRWSLGLFEDRLALAGNGLLIWNDPDSASVPYLPNFSSTYPRLYTIASGEGRFELPLATDVSLALEGEYAGSRYQDDLNQPGRTFEDWALRAEASLAVEKVRASVSFLNVGPYYYSPGAQTNRFSAFPKNGYLSTNANKDDMLNGYLNKFSLQSMDRPSFAFYDRLSENILPYGDATPNRLVWSILVGGEFGEEGWIRPALSFIPAAREVQGNYVLNNSGNGAVAVENGTAAPNAVPRAFGGYEGAITLDLSKVLQGAKTLRVGVDYKHQTSDVGSGDPLRVDTFLGAVDFTVPVKGVLETLTWSAAYMRTLAGGQEYVVTTSGAPPTAAAYPFYMETAALGTYSLQDFDVDRTTYSIGVQYPLSKTIQVRGDLFLDRFSRPVPAERDYWRISYEASF